MAQGKRIQLWKFVIIAAVLTCGGLIVGISVAKMVSNQAADASRLQVAKWSVSADGDKDEIALTAGGDEKTVTLTVTNGSEVASEYAIILSGIPDGVKVGIDEGNLRAPANGVVEFSSDGYSLNTSDHKVETHTLRFAATLTDETIEISDENIAIDVAFTQKDPQ